MALGSTLNHFHDLAVVGNGKDVTILNNVWFLGLPQCLALPIIGTVNSLDDFLCTSGLCALIWTFTPTTVGIILVNLAI